MHKMWLNVKVYGNFEKRFEENGWQKPPFFNFKYDPFETYDCTVFDYLKTVFDASKNISLTKETKGPRDANGRYLRSCDYTTRNGIEFTLELLDTFPIPEVSSYSFICSEFSDDLVDEIRIAFGQYYRTEFKICENTGSSVRLYETEEDKKKREAELYVVDELD